MSAEPITYSAKVALDRELRISQDSAQQLHAALRPWLDEPHSAEDALTLLRQLRELRQSLATAEATVEAHCCDVMERNEQQVRGYLFERKGSYKRTWDHRGIAYRLATDENGEVLPTTAAVDAILSAAGIGYWRTTALKDAGVPVDEYAHKEALRRTVQFRQVIADE